MDYLTYENRRKEREQEKAEKAMRINGRLAILKKDMLETLSEKEFALIPFTHAEAICKFELQDEADEEQEEPERHDCPIHGSGRGKDCPRC